MLVAMHDHNAGKGSPCESDTPLNERSLPITSTPPLRINLKRFVSTFFSRRCI